MQPGSGGLRRIEADSSRIQQDPAGSSRFKQAQAGCRSVKTASPKRTSAAFGWGDERRVGCFKGSEREQRPGLSRPSQASPVEGVKFRISTNREWARYEAEAGHQSETRTTRCPSGRASGGSSPHASPYQPRAMAKGSLIAMGRGRAVALCHGVYLLDGWARKTTIGEGGLARYGGLRATPLGGWQGIELC
ncbi:hypothetical protein AOQ84DRAFT_365244 [Glonium stellatum]|uniref:Uncharacterized protein n=1 Tax=Glonium stellatum TaxID=574774 RepID=A0A8E2JRQ7_9PEZI|nr:hypothetical protein AOQ84DRAFT_365244 [Glonium stellatum]